MRPKHHLPPGGNKHLSWKRIVHFVILASAIVSCSPSGSGPEPTSGPSEGPTSATDATARPTTAPTPTPEPEVEGGEVLVVPEIVVPPLDYQEVLEVKIASGEWTLEEGLLALLKTFAGQLDPVDVLGDDQPLEDEMGGVIASAQEYLETGPDAAVKEEIQGLLDVLIPSADRLLPYARPEPSSASPPLLYLASSREYSPARQDTECEELWEDGFPPGESVTCIQYAEVALPGGTGRVFYPADWWPGGENLQYAQAGSAALKRAAETFAQFRPTHSVDMVFTQVNSTDSRAPLMITPPRDEETCLVVIYPSALESAKKNGIDVFRQVIAHEIFHCFQAWNFPAMAKGGYLANQWWIEGSAEYFSNVAYPTVNREHNWVRSFNRISAVKPLYDIHYENTTFFQYLANQISDQGVVDFLESIPYSKDPQVSIGALAGLANFQTLFHSFAEDWADRTIADSGGGILPTEVIIPSSDRVTVRDSQVVNFTAIPFLLKRYLVKYMTDNVYEITNSTSGTSGVDTARLLQDPFSWEQPPSNVSGKCGESPYIYITTSGEHSIQPHLLDADVDAELSREEDPDCCLIGTWKLDGEKFALNMIDPGPQLTGIMEAELLSVGGDLRLEFRKNSRYTAFLNGLVINYRFSAVTDAQGNPMWVDSIVVYDGQVAGTFRTQGGETLTGEPLQTTATMTQSMGNPNPEPQDLSYLHGVLPGAEDQSYVCEEDKLTFTYTDRVTEASYQNVFTRLTPPP